VCLYVSLTVVVVVVISSVELRGLEAGLKCNDLLTKFTGLSSEEEANKYCIL